MVNYEIDTSPSDSDEEIQSDGCGSPRMQRKKRPKTFRAEKVERSITFRTLDELLYNDSLPEVIITFWSSGGVVVKLLAYGARDLGFDSRSRHYDFRDWLSPASKS